MSLSPGRSKSIQPFGMGRAHDPHESLLLVRGSGSHVWDGRGRRYIDFVCGYSSLNMGHCHPQLVKAAQTQLEGLHFCTGNQSLKRHELEQALLSMASRSASWNQADPTQAKVWLSTTGARAVEIAWKIAYAHRPGALLRFDIGYHGRSLATAHLSQTLRSNALQHTLRGESPDHDGMVGIVPYPRCGSQCDGMCPQCEASLAVAADILMRNASKLCGMILEPAIGSKGYYFANPFYYRRLVSMVRQAGLLVISDEVQMGLGRLGALIASHAQGWQPDLIVLGKALGAGICPISAVIGDAHLMDDLPQGVESETFAATPLACRVALESLKMLDDEILLKQVQERGGSFREQLRQMLPAPIGVDGVGMATAIDLSALDSSFADRFAKEKIMGDTIQAASEGHHDIGWKWVTWLRENGLLVHLTGAQQNRVAIIPPLNVDDTTMQQALKILSQFWQNS